MPESWVRGAILVRINSLIRGHSGVRWELIEKMAALLRANITPLVPLRGSISASGGTYIDPLLTKSTGNSHERADLSPLSYVAGTLIGNPSIRVFDGPAAFSARRIISSRQALSNHGLEPIVLGAKEHLGILNGTAFSASVASLVLSEAVHLALLAQICTAMGTEALLGVRGNYAPFIHEVARPHPGQVCFQPVYRSIIAGFSRMTVLRSKPRALFGGCCMTAISLSVMRRRSPLIKIRVSSARIVTLSGLRHNSLVPKLRISLPQ
jgi:phenylalanine ammonia-lyase